MTCYSNYSDQEILELLDDFGDDVLIHEVAKRFRMALNSLSTLEARYKRLADRLDEAVDRHTRLSS